MLDASRASFDMFSMTVRTYYSYGNELNKMTRYLINANTNKYVCTTGIWIEWKDYDKSQSNSRTEQEKRIITFVNKPR